MLQPSVILQIEDQEPIPQSPFCPLLDQAKTTQSSHFSLNFKRDVDASEIMLQIFNDRVVGVSGRQAYYFNLENQISFGFDLLKKKIWFTKSENGAKQIFLAENQDDLKFFIENLRTKCPQQNFSSNYDLLEEKGKGKNSCVYTARKKNDETIYAVKIQKYSSKLKQEIEILRELHHPNIIFLHQYFIESDNQAYIVMEYEDGGSLLGIIKSEQQLSPKEKIKFITDMLNGLEYLRIKGIVHRDLKPQNILYSEKDGNYKIADFGFSIKVGQKLQKIAGTPGYIAPELLKEKSTDLEADIKSDIYSMGLIFYEILTFKQYYQGNSSEQILKRNMQKISLKKKEKTGFEINNMEYSLLEKMIRSEPDKRKNSCQILKSELFRKVNKLYGLDYLSSTGSPSKTSGEDEADDGLVDSFWKMIRLRSWSN